MFVMPVGYFKKNTSVYMGAILEEYNMMYILEPDAKILFFVSSTKKKYHKMLHNLISSHFIGKPHGLLCRSFNTSHK